MPYPHVRRGEEQNTFRVNLTPGQAEIRLNHEEVLVVRQSYPPVLEAGFLIETFDDSPAEVIVHRLTIWQE